MGSVMFDVVITFGGRFDMLSKCLASVYRNATVPITITIVDDASDKTEKKKHLDLFSYNKSLDVRNNVNRFTAKRHETVEGFPRTANDGAKSRKGKYVTILNDDVELDDGYFENVLEAFKSKENIGIVGTRLRFPMTSTHPNRPAGKVQHIGIALTTNADAVHPLVGWGNENLKTRQSREVFAVTGAAMTILGDIFTSLGGFDPIFGLGTWEDVDLCLRVRQKGYKIWMDERVSGFHYTGATVEKKQIAYPLKRNGEIFRARWGNSGLLVYDLWTYG